MIHSLVSRRYFGITILSVLGSLFVAVGAQGGDGLVATGWNNHGQLGDGTMSDRTSGVGIRGDVSSVASGFVHSLFITSDGSLWTMGWNFYGQLGDGTAGFGTDKSTPVMIKTFVEEVAAGEGHSLFIDIEKVLWGMGLNSSGQLGVESSDPKPTPVPISSGVKGVAAGANHSLFIKQDGTLWGMGYNANGRLGDGTKVNRSTPVLIYPNPAFEHNSESRVVALAGGANHSLFVTTEGTLMGMGWAAEGQLGLGDDVVTEQTEPLVIVAEGVQDVSAGLAHSLFLMSDGTLMGMGDNTRGMLGQEVVPNPDFFDTDFRYLPVEIDTNVTEISAGCEHSLYLKSNGTLMAMGWNSRGQLGDGTTTDRHEPIVVNPNVSAIAGGERHSLYLVSEPSVEGILGGADHPVDGLADWWASPWFGFFNTTLAPWIFHDRHGFLYLSPGSDTGSMFFYDIEMQTWWYTNTVIYPYLYIFDPTADMSGDDLENDWVFYFDEDGDTRYFAPVTGPLVGRFLEFGKN